MPRHFCTKKEAKGTLGKRSDRPYLWKMLPLEENIHKKGFMTWCDVPMLLNVKTELRQKPTQLSAVSVQSNGVATAMEFNEDH